ncbi:MAG: hypothetical protein NVS9B2_28190 [Steroidobacteraceae bacterium]
MSGVDIEGRYVLDMGALSLKNAGRISFNFPGSVAVDNVIQVVPGRLPFDCTGYYGPTCTGEGPTSPIPKWSHKMRATWEARNDFEVSLNWRHIGHRIPNIPAASRICRAQSLPSIRSCRPTITSTSTRVWTSARRST